VEAADRGQECGVADYDTAELVGQRDEVELRLAVTTLVP
jgi:hypothetical protein